MADKGRHDILLVEDESAITEPLAEALEREASRARVAGTAAEALSMAASREPDLVLLDIGLPDGSGAGRLPHPAPAEQRARDHADGARLGGGSGCRARAGRRRLRCQALLRPRGDREGERSCGGRRRPGPGETIEIGKLRLDPDRHSATLDAKEIELSRKEFKLLQTLMERAGTVITRQALLEEVWDMNWFGSTKTLDVHMSGLRKKLGDDASDPQYIHTVRGVGFRFAAPDEA